MADAKDAKFFDQIRDAVKALPGFTGNAEQATLQLLGKTEKPKDANDIAALEKAAEGFFKKNETSLTLYKEQFERSTHKISEGLKAGTNPKLLHAEFNAADAKAANGDLIKLFSNKAAKSDDVLGKYVTTLAAHETSLNQGLVVLKAADNLVDPNNIKEADAAKADVAALLKGKTPHTLDVHFEQFDKHLDTSVKSSLTKLQADITGKTGEELKTAEKALKEFEAHVADAKKIYRESHTGVLNGVADVKVLVGHAQDQATAAKTILDKGKGYTNSHGLTQALTSIEDPAKGAIFERTEANAGTVAKNIGTKFEGVAKELATATKSISRNKAAAIVGVATAGTLLLATQLAKKDKLNENGEPVVNQETGKNEKSTSPWVFGAVAAVGVGAMVLAGVKTEKGKEIVNAVKEFSWVDKVLSSRAGNALGFNR